MKLGALCKPEKGENNYYFKKVDDDVMPANYDFIWIFLK